MSKKFKFWSLNVSVFRMHKCEIRSKNQLSSLQKCALFSLLKMWKLFHQSLLEKILSKPMILRTSLIFTIKESIIHSKLSANEKNNIKRNYLWNQTKSHLSLFCRISKGNICYLLNYSDWCLKRGLNLIILKC